MPLNFPSSLDTYETLLRPFNIYKWSSSLKSSVAKGDLIITLTDTIDIPSYVAKTYIGIDDEIFWVESIDNTGVDKKLTVTRAQGDSTVAEHALATEVKQVYTAEYHNQLRLAIEAIEAYILGASPVPLTVALTASPHTYTFTGYIGYNYVLKIAVKDSTGLIKQVKSYLINQWNDAVNVPQTVEGMLFEIGSGIDIQVNNLVANVATFDIVVTGANGGEMKITVHEKGAIE